MDREAHLDVGTGTDPDDDARYHRETDDWELATAIIEETHDRGLDFGLLVLRLGSLLLLPHGLAKAADMPAFTRAVDSNVVGGQAPELFAWLVMLGQVALPVLLTVGLLTRPAAFLCAAMMASIWALAVLTRLDYTVLADHGGLTGENALLLDALTLPLAFTGAGRWSLDRMRLLDRT